MSEIYADGSILFNKYLSKFFVSIYDDFDRLNLKISTNLTTDFIILDIYSI